ncbi:hypothetical protein HUJ04_001436 [Dendroctonus ponderosae]|nr:hypothetical protein HUJ04_001436 [Dendroctonus ponderosae]
MLWCTDKDVRPIIPTVRKYVRKTARQQWSTESIELAIDAVISYKKASDQFEVSQSTLERYVKKRRNDPDSVV